MASINITISLYFTISWKWLTVRNTMSSIVFQRVSLRECDEKVSVNYIDVHVNLCPLRDVNGKNHRTMLIPQTAEGVSAFLNHSKDFHFDISLPCTSNRCANTSWYNSSFFSFKALSLSTLAKLRDSSSDKRRLAFASFAFVQFFFTFYAIIL